MKIVRVVPLLAAIACAPKPPVSSPIDIVASEYSFTAPDTVKAGTQQFRLVNHGKVLHEVQMFRFASGIARDSAIKLLSAESFPDSLIEPSGAVLITMPAHTAPGRLEFDMQAGELYALVCDFHDTPTSPKHSKLGMFRVMQVAGK